MNFISLILTLSVITGQLIRVPFGTHGGITLLDISVICFIIFGFLKNKFELKSPPVFLKIFFCFLLVCLISLGLTPLHLTSQEFLSSLFYTVRLAFYALFFWLIFSKSFGSLQNKQILLYSGLGLAFLGLLQFVFLPDLGFLTVAGWDPHYFRTTTTFFDPNFAGAFFALTFIILFHKKSPLFFFILTFLALLTTFSRSSYLMFLVGSLSLSFLNRSKKLAVVSILLFLTLMLGFQIYTQLVARPRGIDRGQSAQFRLSTWQQGFTIFQKSPLIGVGYNSYRYAIREYKLADEQFYKSHGASGNDSSLLFVLATTGILGFIVYILFLVSLLKYTIGNNFVLVAAVLGLLAHSFFANSLFYPFILIWLILKAADTKD